MMNLIKYAQNPGASAPSPIGMLMSAILVSLTSFINLSIYFLFIFIILFLSP